MALLSRSVRNAGKQLGSVSALFFGILSLLFVVAPRFVTAPLHNANAALGIAGESDGGVAHADAPPAPSCASCGGDCGGCGDGGGGDGGGDGGCDGDGDDGGDDGDDGDA